MLVDGHAVTFAVGDRLDLGDGVVIGRATATTHQIETPLDFVEMLDHDSYLDLSVHAGSVRGPGSFEGLLGNLDGNSRSDFGLPHGSSLINPSTKVIEGLFARCLAGRTARQHAREPRRRHCTTVHRTSFSVSKLP
ncbi:hypothetical protein FXB40_37705 [Bradyrhizobium rifense]|uniref:Uncharacterized protein n=1 Tax=Bradyrhizobium rifense TaxID=515499 RepID=A0A5D3K5G1_9BRAD|nr:hypothetical protein [Bradyrhizobium rifense]TYL88732.1 hypothetical protein FXB40_37705 [Bradyrhizobium rifense]